MGLSDALNVRLRPKLLSPFPTDFTPAAPVGNSCYHLNAGKLAAGGLPSLCENDALLYTFIAFKIVTVIILVSYPKNVKIFLHLL